MRLVGLLLFISLLGSGPLQAPQVAPRSAPSRVAVAEKGEPGEPLGVKGTVYGSDGKTALADVSVYVYHTDANGLYTPVNNDSRNPRLRGYMRTSAEGRYEFTTIKPAPYPNNSIPAHIHYVVTAPGYKDRIFEIVFEGDPLINAEMRSRAAVEDSAFSIRPLTRDQQGGWHCTQDIRLKK